MDSSFSRRLQTEKTEGLNQITAPGWAQNFISQKNYEMLNMLQEERDYSYWQRWERDDLMLIVPIKKKHNTQNDR